MCRDCATPSSPLKTEGLFFLDKTLTVWEDIRNALAIVEELRQQQSHKNARVEVYQQSENQVGLKVIFRSVHELDEYLNSRIRRMLLDEVSDSIRIEDLESASTKAYNQLKQLNDVHGHVVFE